MATYAPVHPFGGHAFTSTLYDTKTDRGGGLNYWIIIVTGAIFFVTLSWYNVFLVLYNYYILGIPPVNGETPQQQILSVVGYAIIWTVFVILLYLVLTYRNLLTGNPSAEFHDSSRVVGESSLIGIR